MFYLLLLFSLMTLGAGVFLIGFGVPIRETMFGSALIISGTVSLVGGFLLVGLAAAVQELRRMVHGLRRMPGPRPARPADRKEGERRPPPQRAPFPNRSAADAPIPAPTSIDEPPFDLPADIRSDAAAAVEAGLQAEPPHGHADAGIRPESRAPALRPGPAWLRRAIAEIESVPPGEPAPPPPEPLEPRQGEPWHPEEPARRYAPPETPFGRPGAGPPGAGPGERPAPQEGRRPRGGPAAAPLAPTAPVEPEDYAPEPDAWLRPRIPTASTVPVAPVEPQHDYAPEPEALPPRHPNPAPPSPVQASAGQPGPGGQPNPGQPAPAPSIFDMVWANDRRRPGPAGAPEPRPDPQAYAPPRPVERPAPPAQPVPMPAPPAAAPPRPEPPRPEFARPEPVRPDLIRPEPVRPEPARHEPARHEAARYEPARHEPVRHEPMRQEALRPEAVRHEPPRPEPRPEPRPLSILKSGVIDEMAYTLFNDGSIEAQMPDGTMRFSSIDELRRHLDQNDG